jgi:hypothetical protein
VFGSITAPKSTSYIIITMTAQTQEELLAAHLEQQKIHEIHSLFFTFQFFICNTLFLMSSYSFFGLL